MGGPAPALTRRSTIGAVPLPAGPAAPGAADGAQGAQPASSRPLTARQAALNIASFIVSLNPSAHRDVNQIAARLLAGFNDDGVLDQAEFEDATGQDLSTEAWDALIGSDQGGFQRVDGENVIKDLRHLSHYMEQFQAYSRATGVSFQRFAGWTDITIVSSAELVGHMLGLSEGNIAALARTHTQELVAFLGRSYSIPDDCTTAQKQARLEEILLALQQQARGGGPDAARARHKLLYVGLIVMDRITQAADDNGVDLSDLNEANKDPLVARHFLGTVFDGIVGECEITRNGAARTVGPPQTTPHAIDAEQTGNIQQYAAQVAQLRTLIGPEPVTVNGEVVSFDEINPNYTVDGSNPFDAVLALVARGPSEDQSDAQFRTGLRSALRNCRTMDQTEPPPASTTGGDAEGHAAPVAPPVITGGNQVPPAPARPETEEAPPAPAAPLEVSNYGYPPGQPPGQPVTAVV